MRRLLAVVIALALRRFVRDAVLLLSYVAAGLTVLALLTWRGLVPDQLHAAGTGGLALALLLALLSATRYRRRDAAVALDRRAGLRERATTALDAITKGRDDHPFAARVIAEAESGARGNPLRLFPYRLGRRALALVATVAGLAAVLSLPSRPVVQAAPQPPLPTAAGPKLTERARAVEKLADQLGERDVAAAARRLAEAGQSITAGKGTREQAVREIRSARSETDRYRKRTTSAGPALEQARQRLGSGASTRELGLALSAGDPDAVRKAMQSLAQSMTSGGFDRKVLAAVGQGLASLAQSQTPGDLQKLIEQAAHAAATGDGERLSELLEQARQMAASMPPQPAAPRGIPQPDAVQSMLRQAASDAVRAEQQPGSPSQADLDQLASGLEHLAQAMTAAGEAELAGELNQAATTARAGNREELARQLSALAERVQQALARMDQGRRQAESLSALLHKTEALLGLGQPVPLAEADYGVGSSDQEAAAFRTASERRNRDRQSPFRTERTRDYSATHAPKLLENANFEATRVDGIHGSGGMSYVEYRAPAVRGRIQLAGEAVPGTMAEGVEEALSKEAVPPGYRQQIRKYFDTGADPGHEEKP